MSVRSPDVGSSYDKRMLCDPRLAEYYDGSYFFNFGYWTEQTSTQKEACQNLIEKLLAYPPEKGGSILDVACGMGATTKYLLKYYKCSEVIGINISYKQLAISRVNAPGCTFLLMDAAKLGFKDNVFDTVMCVEAAFHFDTREDFLREAYRALKPSGHLVLSDILLRKWGCKWHPMTPEKNYVRDLKEYRDLYLRTGFQHVEVFDATKQCWKGFYNHLWRWRREKFSAGEIKLPAYIKMILRNLLANAGLKCYLLVSAKKL
ncbi:MAG: methyltransferase domain-containing protein [Deltaproteobacteria bacterium]|nr:methyltransferase domain-containing protein [Deltaproteobacteria bacterium]